MAHNTTSLIEILSVVLTVDGGCAQGLVPDAGVRQQGGPGGRALRGRGGGPRPGALAARALHRDQRQGAAAARGRRLPRGTCPHPHPHPTQLNRPFLLHIFINDLLFRNTQLRS